MAALREHDTEGEAKLKPVSEYEAELKAANDNAIFETDAMGRHALARSMGGVALGRKRRTGVAR